MQEQKVWRSLLMRCVTWEQCRRKIVPFPTQSQWLALLKQGDDEVMAVLLNLAKQVL